MIKKFRLKISTPWAPRGVIYEGCNSWWVTKVGEGISFHLHPSNYPDLFEPVEEKSEVERVEEWLVRIVGYENPKAYHNKLAKKLLSVGLSIDKLEGLG